MNVWLAVGSKISLGGVAGYMTGRFFKQITDKMIWMAGLSTCLVTGLHLMGWVTINFSKIDKDLLHIYSRAKS